MDGLVKNILEVLFVHGRVLISARRNFRRVYDLPERVLPPSILGATAADAPTALQWSIRLRLRFVYSTAGLIHGLLPFQIIADAIFGASQSTGK